jgi:hypothetical protein
VNLALRLSATEAVVYRKPWGLIAFTAFTALCLATAATVFGLLGYRELKSNVGIPFVIIGAIFAAFTLLMLFDLARKSSTWLRNGGVALVTATKSGIAITPNFNVAPKIHDWSDISEIVLAGRLETRKTNETEWSGSRFIVFLAPAAVPPTLIGRAMAHIAISAAERPFLATDFHDKSAHELQTALRRLAPAHVLIRRCKRAVFDHKARTDTYETA